MRSVELRGATLCGRKAFAGRRTGGTAARPCQARVCRAARLATTAAQLPELLETTGKVLTGRTPQSPFHTGSTDITTAGTAPLVDRPLPVEKQVVLGDSDGALLTDFGEQQAARCRDALAQIPFDSCFSSPIQRGWRFAELVWADRGGPLVPMDSLREAHLGWLQGMRQEEAAGQHEATFRQWRERPAEFEIDGRWPVREVFAAARVAWQGILEAEGSCHLVVTHKSILRALLCVALGLPQVAFRAVDVHNGGVCVFRVNRRGEPMLINLNMTAHIHNDGVHY